MCAGAAKPWETLQDPGGPGGPWRCKHWPPAPRDPSATSIIGSGGVSSRWWTRGSADQDLQRHTGVFRGSETEILQALADVGKTWAGSGKTFCRFWENNCRGPGAFRPGFVPGAREALGGPDLKTRPGGSGPTGLTRTAGPTRTTGPCKVFPTSAKVPVDPQRSALNLHRAPLDMIFLACISPPSIRNLISGVPWTSRSELSSQSCSEIQRLAGVSD